MKTVEEGVKAVLEMFKTTDPNVELACQNALDTFKDLGSVEGMPAFVDFLATKVVFGLECLVQEGVVKEGSDNEVETLYRSLAMNFMVVGVMIGQEMYRDLEEKGEDAKA